jgi:hypothetical protein
MRKVVASPFLSRDGPADFVTDVDDAMEENLRSVSR